MAHNYPTTCINCGQPALLIYTFPLNAEDLVPWTCKACETDQAFSPNEQTKLNESNWSSKNPNPLKDLREAIEILESDPYEK